MLERIDFDEREARTLRRAATWMMLAGIGCILFGVLDATTALVDILAAVLYGVVGASLCIGGFSLRRVATTDGRDQAELARTMWHLRNALAIKGVYVIVYVGVMIVGAASMGAFAVVQILGR